MSSSRGFRAVISKDKVPKMHRMLPLMDYDESGMVSRDKLKELLHVFSKFDKNDDSFITAIEVKQVMHEMGQDISEEQAEQMLAEIDKEGSGRVTYQRFKSMMLNDDADGSPLS